MSELGSHDGPGAAIGPSMDTQDSLEEKSYREGGENLKFTSTVASSLGNGRLG